jgi:hypothetical protein
MAPIRTLLALLLAAGAAAAADLPQSALVRVPVVGSVWGIGGVRWKTNVDLYNDSSKELTVRVALPAADAPELLFSIGPGATQRFPDIAEAFSIEQALSPLEIETFDTKRPVRVTATVYGVRGEELISPEPIPVDYGSGAYYPQRALNGLSFSDTFRTNIGLANLGTTDATFTLALQRLAGRNLALTRITLQPNSLTHISIQSLFPLITKGDDFTVVVETGSRDTYVYASVIDNITSEAKFIQPAVGTSMFGSQGEMATARP